MSHFHMDTENTYKNETRQNVGIKEIDTSLTSCLFYYVHTLN